MLHIGATDGDARTGVLRTAHGEVRTPAFMPVGTHATVKACTPQEVRSAGADILLCNGYHLVLRPGVEMLERAGGIHAFMRWDGPILTDSGGFQMVSLQDVARIDDDGAVFVSPYDGSRLRVTPEDAVRAQGRIGADVVMCLDHPVGFGAGVAETSQAMRRTHTWAERCLAAHPGEGHLLFGITQGGFDAAMRRESARIVGRMGFDGVAVGGLALGEPPPVMEAMARAAVEELPEQLPRYVMGLGSDTELLAMVAIGIDMFDCVLPTRLARNGTLLTAGGRLSLRQAQWREDLRPVDEGCPCPGCEGGFTRAYLRHLFQAGEILAHRLASLHNLTHLGRLMDGARRAVAAGRFDTYRQAVLAGLAGGVDSGAARLSPVGYSSAP